jgi:hypothetical protein
MPNLELKGYSIDDITKGLGACAIGAYVLGYLVLSYYLSTFGFNPVSPFRPRVLETGICTLILFGMPIVLGAAIASIPSRGMPYVLVLSMRILCLPILCVTISWLPGFIGDLPRTVSLPVNHRIAKLCILIALVFLIPVVNWIFWRVVNWIWHNYHKRKLISMVIICCVSILSVFRGTDWTNTAAQVRTFFWLLISSIITCLFIGSGSEKTEQKRIEQELREVEQEAKKLDAIVLEINGEVRAALPAPNQEELNSRVSELQDRTATIIAELRSETSTLRLRRFVNIFAPLMAFGYSFVVIAAYTNWVFPFIPLKLGGGEIVAVTLYLTEGNQQTRVVSGGMLDQSDQGYFILPSDRDKGLFVPKERVDAIYFAKGPPELSKILK